MHQGVFIPSLAAPQPQPQPQPEHSLALTLHPCQPTLYTPQVWPDLFTLKFNTPGLHIVTAHIRSIAPPRGFKEWGNLIWADFQKV